MNKYDYDTGVSSSLTQQPTDNVVSITGQDTNDPPQSGEATEARNSLRRRVLKTGQIQINQNYSEIPCRLRNTSETGALIEVAEKYIVPDSFTLCIPMDGFSVACQIARRNGTKIGIQFVGEKQPLSMEKTQSIRSSSDPYLENLIRKEKYVVEPLSDTQKAIRRDGSHQVVSKPGFGKRIT